MVLQELEHSYQVPHEFFLGWGPELNMCISFQGLLHALDSGFSPSWALISITMSGTSSWVAPRAEGTSAGMVSPRQFIFFSIFKNYLLSSMNIPKRPRERDPYARQKIWNPPSSKFEPIKTPMNCANNWLFLKWYLCLCLSHVLRNLKQSGVLRKLGLLDSLFNSA